MKRTIETVELIAFLVALAILAACAAQAGRQQQEILRPASLLLWPAFLNRENRIDLALAALWAVVVFVLVAIVLGVIR